MGIISNFVKKIFGSPKAEASVPSNENYIDQWEKERQDRIVAAEERLKDWIVVMLKEKGSLSFTWESGNDEAFVTFQGATDLDRSNFEDLEEYIVLKLDIPDAGEFQMNGSGAIYSDNNLARAKYSSTMKAIIDYNEETEEEVFSEEEQDSGDKILFAI